MRELSPLRARRVPLTESEKKVKQDKVQNNSLSSTGKMHPDQMSAMPNATWYPRGDTYGHMRAMVLAASLPDDPAIGGDSPVQDHPFSAAYSSVDQDIIERAARLCGFAPKKMGDGNSKEPDHVHKHSPVNHNSGKHR